MSFAYNSQPNTKGKVILHTSGGDLEIELWPKEAPKACRNFVQLCMEGYYNNTLFHRIIKNFIIQGGDPTGTGSGGESIYGKPFEDEFHSRLRFVQRGLLAMANSGHNTNQSQFFFTLGPTEELNGKNTIFGKVVGNTIFNLLKLGELETDKNDKPFYPASIKRVTILSNPFDDIIPRHFERVSEPVVQEKLEKQKPKRNPKLLSFDQEPQESVKIKPAFPDAPLSRDAPSSVPSTKEDKKRKLEFDDQMKAQVIKTLESKPMKDSVREQVEKLKSQIKTMDAPKKETTKVEKKKKSLVDEMRSKYLQEGKAIATKFKQKDSDMLLSEMKHFSSVLKEAKQAPSQETKKIIVDEDWECDLHFIKGCESCRDTFGQEEETDDKDWMAAKLVFKKEVGANVFQPKIDDYTVIDPRQGMKSDIFGRDLTSNAEIWKDKSLRHGKRN